MLYLRNTNQLQTLGQEIVRGTSVAPIPPSGSLFVSYILVGGGAAGGRALTSGREAGGGGGGGYVTSSLTLTSSVSYNVFVGSGGTASVGSTNLNGQNGADTWISASSLTSSIAWGGGGGGTNPVNVYVDGAAGGSGIVIIRYADSYAAATSTTGSPTITVAGGYRVYKWTGSGSITI